MRAPRVPHNTREPPTAAQQRPSALTCDVKPTQPPCGNRARDNIASGGRRCPPRTSVTKWVWTSRRYLPTRCGRGRAGGACGRAGPLALSRVCSLPSLAGEDRGPGAQLPQLWRQHRVLWGGVCVCRARVGVRVNRLSRPCGAPTPLYTHALTLLHPYSPIPLPSYTPLHPSTIYIYTFTLIGQEEGAREGMRHSMCVSYLYYSLYYALYHITRRRHCEGGNETLLEEFGIYGLVQGLGFRV